MTEEEFAQRIKQSRTKFLRVLSKNRIDSSRFSLLKNKTKK